MQVALGISRRAKRADGGVVDAHHGPIVSPIPGRTDKIPMDVVSGSYVVPADIVSGLGEGNTLAGLNKLASVFKAHPFSKPKRKRREQGGLAGFTPTAVPIIAAGGEFVIPPERVKELGGGDMAKGHAMLDDWVLGARQELIRTLQALPGPAKD